eukprot:Nk52_evm22s273 gene=Nk52_evmTU22s273
MDDIYVASLIGLQLGNSIFSIVATCVDWWSVKHLDGEKFHYGLFYNMQRFGLQKDETKVAQAFTVIFTIVMCLFSILVMVRYWKRNMGPGTTKVYVMLTLLCAMLSVIPWAALIQLENDYDGPYNVKHYGGWYMYIVLTGLLLFQAIVYGRYFTEAVEAMTKKEKQGDSNLLEKEDGQQPQPETQEVTE